MITVNLPNFILENKSSYKIINDKNFVASKSIIHRKNQMSLRNSMHILILLIDGKKILHLENKNINIDTKEILYLAQGNYFMTEKISFENSFESILLCFDDDFVLNFIKKYNIKLNNDLEESSICIAKDKLMSQCVETINDYFSLNLKNKLDLIKLKTEELFLYTLSKDPTMFSSFLNKIINTKSSRTKYILESNLDIINSVQDMSKLTRLSNAVLRKEMLRLYKKKPKQWLDEQRLKKAVHLLENSTESISNIATSCGYSTVSWFIVQFRKHYKSTPFLYREENL